MLAKLSPPWRTAQTTSSVYHYITCSPVHIHTHSLRNAVFPSKLPRCHHYNSLVPPSKLLHVPIKTPSHIAAATPNFQGARRIGAGNTIPWRLSSIRLHTSYIGASHAPHMQQLPEIGCPLNGDTAPSQEHVALEQSRDEYSSAGPPHCV